MKTSNPSAPAEKLPAEKFGETFSRRAAIRLALCACAAPALALGSLSSAFAAALPQQQTPSSQIPPSSVLEPVQLAALLSSGEKPTIICVGFKFLYDTAHIPNSLFLGPAREADGIAALEKWAGAAPRGKMVVLYCGCCPWDKCPNIHPAYAALTKLGFSQLRVVRIDRDFATDWDNRGFPTTKK